MGVVFRKNDFPTIETRGILRPSSFRPLRSAEEQASTTIQTARESSDRGCHLLIMFDIRKALDLSEEKLSSGISLTKLRFIFFEADS